MNHGCTSRQPVAVCKYVYIYIYIYAHMKIHMCEQCIYVYIDIHMFIYVCMGIDSPSSDESPLQAVQDFAIVDSLRESTPPQRRWGEAVVTCCSKAATQYMVGLV